MRRNRFRPSVELLETRDLMAGGIQPPLPPPVTQPSVYVMDEQLLKPLHILPGAQDVVLDRIMIGTNGFARLDEQLMLFKSPFSSASTIQQTWITVDGQIVAFGNMDQHGVADFNFFDDVWATRNEVPVEEVVHASFGNYFDASTESVQPVQLYFRDARNNPIDDSRVSYDTVRPTQHALVRDVLDVSQISIAGSAQVQPGQNVELLRFYAWSNTTLYATMAFDATEGSLLNARRYHFVHTSWDGVVDNDLPATLQGDRLMFNVAMSAYEGSGTWSLMATISPANALVPDHRLQVSFVADASGFSANDRSTGLPMEGVLINGQALDPKGGQMQFWGSTQYATAYNIVVPTLEVFASLDAGTPLNQTVAGNQTVVAAKYKFTALDDSFVLNELKVSVSQQAAPVVNYAQLWNGTTLLGASMIDQSGQAYFTGLNTPISANTSKVLTVVLNLTTPYTDGNISTTGVNAKVTMTYVKASNSQGLVTIQNPGIAGNDLRVYKSFPTFSTLSLPSGQGAQLSSGGTTTLYRFAVAADSHGPVALKNMTFTVSTVGGTLDNFQLFRGTADITITSQVQFIGGNGVVAILFNTEEQIPAGNFFAYSLKATASGFQVGNSVVTGLLSNAFWSDLSAQQHDFVLGQMSSDWFTGSSLPNFPLDQYGIVAQ